MRVTGSHSRSRRIPEELIVRLEHFGRTPLIVATAGARAAAQPAATPLRHDDHSRWRVTVVREHSGTGYRGFIYEIANLSSRPRRLRGAPIAVTHSDDTATLITVGDTPFTKTGPPVELVLSQGQSAVGAISWGTTSRTHVECYSLTLLLPGLGRLNTGFHTDEVVRDGEFVVTNLAPAH
jgi:hypothetical protein